jgi:RNA polymerase I-specific transcription initiation factor RRN7
MDLWALRLSKLQDRVPDVSDNEGSSHLYSSQSEATSTEAEATSDVEFPSSKRRRRTNSNPTLLDALGMCYLGMHSLRLPFTTGDIIKWVSSNNLVYYRAIQHLPADMKSRLPQHYRRALDPEIVLTPRHLQRSVMKLVFFFQQGHQITFPPLNRPLLLFRLIQELALPLEIYAATSRIASLLGFSFDLPSIHLRRIQNLDIPETQLIAALIVAVKLLYPFDEAIRHPRAPSDPTVAVVDWNSWVARTKEFHSTTETTEISTFDELLQIDDSSIFSMSGEKLDQYLDWYQKVWADETIPDQDQNADFRQAMFAMFPAEPPLPVKLPQEGVPNEQAIQQAQRARLKGVQQDLELRRPITDPEAKAMEEPVMRPGSFYKYYRSVEELPPNAKAFYEAAASLMGMPLHRLVSAVYTTERKLSKWSGEQKPNKKGKEKM